MGAKKILDVESATKALIVRMSEEEKQQVRDWAEKSLVIVNNHQLTRTRKMSELSKLNPPKNILPVLKAMLELTKDKTWRGQSWARRGLFLGLSVGAATFGTQAAGIATAGAGIGVPIALLTTIGATFLGVLVDEISKGKR